MCRRRQWEANGKRGFMRGCRESWWGVRWGRGEAKVKVTMTPSHELRGTVAAPPGFAGRTKVNLLAKYITDGSPLVGTEMLQTEAGMWPEVFEYPVKADGSFVVPDAPVQGITYLAATGKGLGEGQFMTNPAKPDAPATIT